MSTIPSIYKEEIKQIIRSLISNLANKIHTHTKSDITDFPEIPNVIPSGFIGWFKRTTAPDGWVVCDGNNGTPDLIGRYPLGATSDIGSPVSASIPNIVGSVVLTGKNETADGDGPFSGSIVTNNNKTNGSVGDTQIDTVTLSFDASKCSPVYKNTATTITPPSVKLLPCMKL